MYVFNLITKKPLLGMGILMMIVFIMEMHRQGKINWFERKGLNPTSCSAVIVPLKKKTPASWKVFCEDNNLALIMDESSLSTKSSELAKNTKRKISRLFILKKLLYNQMANHLMFVSQSSPEETLSRVLFIRLSLITPEITINALSEGKHISKLRNLSKPEFIALHLKATVQVQEVLPK
jgi:hypothetical protein